MRGPDRADFYQEVEDSHALAVTPRIAEVSTDAQFGMAQQPVDPAEEIEARLAAFEFEQWQKVETGRINATDYFHSVRQFDHDLATEIERGAVPAQPSVSPTGEIDDSRSTSSGQAPVAEAEAEREVYSPYRELTDDMAERVERLLESSRPDESELEAFREVSRDFGRSL